VIDDITMRIDYADDFHFILKIEWKTMEIEIVLTMRGGNIFILFPQFSPTI
jgi:hypothetical protein